RDPLPIRLPPGGRPRPRSRPTSRPVRTSRLSPSRRRRRGRSIRTPRPARPASAPQTSSPTPASCPTASTSRTTPTPPPRHPTAPAQHGGVTDQLSSTLDWSTLEFTEAGFGSPLVPVPAGSHDFRTELPVTENGKDFQVDIELAFDPNSGLLKATFDSLDPLT